MNYYGPFLLPSGNGKSIIPIPEERGGGGGLTFQICFACSSNDDLSKYDQNLNLSAGKRSSIVINNKSELRMTQNATPAQAKFNRKKKTISRFKIQYSYRHFLP